MSRAEAPPALGALLAALAGAAVVLAVFGLGPINPHNQGWLLAGPLGPDPVQLWLGWTYFRHTPWLLPPGANPAYGMELGTAIYFADAIPLLALVLKALRGLVEVPQYVGPWLLACGLLQGFLGWRLMGLATAHPLARICGAGLLALQPMLINRMAGHTPLAGQWTLLAALLLALGPGRGWRQALAWAALLAVTALVHSYLLAMALPLWAADWLRRAWLERDRWLLAEALLVPAAVAAALWTGGFFLLRGGYETGPGSQSGGYGTWNFDLLAFLDGGIWSSLLPDLPDPGHWEAGSSYLGLGGLLLLAAGGLAWLRRPVALPRRLWLLAAALLALLAFAITPRVTIGGWGGWLFTPPEALMRVGGMLRNAERMVWPLSYALMLGAAALAARAWGGQRAGWLLAALLAVQAVDLRPGIARRHSFVAGAPAGVPQRLFDPVWPALAGAYARVRAVPASNMGEGWESIARFAAQAGLPTDSIYMARVDEGAAAALRAKTAGILRSGAYEPGTLYVLRDAASLDLARASHDPARDAILQADGYWLLAPGWRLRPLAGG
ncbi:hypothetical protein JMJ55_19275 [Belnapia sp. T6]|uniref:Uncharacterized protein n=1 Tax=Belnapia mucosa TaxID=2804532 RepID=A0ABS1VAV6_9PROT|nr:DUF6311 domain-containing protein [Belnapia mucosa]MBL6457478.1 hypothetical protein [Belnapia mucosa]